jgi:HptB-dependent secretion and biofilm anti anti-sigma factor
MQVSLKTTGEAAVISLGGRFDFKIHHDFKRCSEAAMRDGAVRRIEVNLEAVDYLDSSALGMLLLLREQAQGRGMDVALRNCHGAVREILDVANFGRLFAIH